MRKVGWYGAVSLGAALASALLASPAGAQGSSTTFMGGLTSVKALGSTVPANGDVNPYGIAVVPTSTGKLVAGDVLLSNFNAKSNVQGTGTTLVEMSPSGGQTLFSQITALPSGSSCPGGIGLTTALAILPGGWVVVGSLPTSAGALPKGDPAGCLIVLNSGGQVAETIVDPNIVGPWDLTASSAGSTASIFVSNALGGNTKVSKKGVPVAGQCTVVRVDLSLSSAAAPVVQHVTGIGSNFPWKANQTALVLAPTGLALSGTGTLYVDNTLTNTISAIVNATTRTTTVTQRSDVIAKGGALSAPLGMVMAPNGDVLVMNGNNGNVVEVTPSGKQTKHTLVKKGAGDLFGLTLTPSGQGLYFGNDGTNMLEVAQP